MPRPTFLALVVSWALLTPAVPGADDRPAKEPSDRVKQALGEKGLAVLKGATAVETFRIKPRPDNSAAETIAGYPMIGKGKALTPGERDELVGVLSDDKTWFGESARCFLPGVVFRVWHDKESADVVVCFQCENHQVHVRDANGEEVHKTGGAFGPDITPLMKLAKKAFPDDVEIQNLKPRKGG
jgi:hypothetical protein